MSDELTTKQIIEGIERNLTTWEEGEGYCGGYDFDAERALVNDLRTLLEITKTALENVTIDVPGPGGVTQRYTVSGVVTVEPTDAVRIEPVTSRPDGGGRCAQRAPADDQRDSSHRDRPAFHPGDHPASEGSRP